MPSNIWRCEGLKNSYKYSIFPSAPINNLGVTAVTPMCKINTLPRELLTDIFEYAVCPRLSEWDTLWQSTPVLHRTLSLARVCLEWHAIVISTPSLWTIINGHPTPSTLRRAWNLSSESNTPLCIGLNPFWRSPRERQEYHEAVKDFCLQIHRTAFLDIHIHAHDLALFLNHLSELGDAPVLEYFRVKPSYPTTYLIPESIFGGKPLPPLRYIELEFCTISWRSPLLQGPKLSTLKLGYQPRLSYTLMLDVFQNMQALEVLSLTHCLPNPPPEVIHDGAVYLPRLKHLELLEDDIESYESFLRTANCAPTTMRIITSPRSPNRRVPQFFNVLGRRVSARRAIKILKIDEDGGLQLEGWTSSSSATPPNFTIAIPSSSRHGQMLTTALTKLPFHALRTLYFYSPFVSSLGVAALSRRLPKLTKVELSRRSTLPLCQVFSQHLSCSVIPFWGAAQVGIWSPSRIRDYGRLSVHIEQVEEARRAGGRPIFFVERGNDHRRL
ncbi:hypothetical protein PLEOSDRAFT_1113720 [Pleurotus ostreatus PC15]|uniref:Uncharacterized protein n=1 Tax=Pleurotus ostreatus (strain PC15) TaxID=1137138 RepID=A0A067N872_PLEO1|nr:hypothetical protein PLEOSDRAFT_1113720 [Pleurotus ostreatus PC15]